MKTLILIILVVVGVLLMFWPKDKKVEIINLPLKIEVANTDTKRVKGLSGRENLPQDAGGLFIFEKPDKYGFWMKDMNFAIDIVWLDETGEIVHLEKNVAPATYPEIFYPSAAAIYVLETNAGFFGTQNIRVGERLQIKGL